MIAVLSIIGLVLLLAVFLYSGPALIWDSLFSADPVFFAAGAAFLLALLLLGGWRFHLLSGRLKSLSFPKTFYVLCFSQVVNQGTLASAGELSKAALLKKLHGVSFSRSLGVVLLERGQDVLFSFALGALFLYQYQRDWLWPVAVASAVLFALVALLLFLPAGSFGFLSRFPQAGNVVMNFRDGARGQSPSVLALSLAVTAATFLVGAAANWFLLSSLGASVGFWTVLSVNFTGLLIGFLSGLPAGIGSREAALVFLYGIFGVAAPVVVAASLLNRILFVVFSYAGMLASGNADRRV